MLTFLILSVALNSATGNTQLTVISKWIATTDSKREFREIQYVGWKEYFKDVVLGNPYLSSFKEVEKGVDYVILLTTDRGKSNNFYLKITNVDIKWGPDKTIMNYILDYGKWNIFNNKSNTSNESKMTTDNSNPCYLPKECELVNVILHTGFTPLIDTTENVMKCYLTNNDAPIDFDSLQIPKSELCKLGISMNDTAYGHVSFNANPWSHFILIQRTFNYSNLVNFMDSLIAERNNKIIHTGILFNFLHGFQVNFFQTYIQETTNLIKLEFSKFHLYLNETKRIESCQDLVGLDHDKTSLFLDSQLLSRLELERCQYDIKICPLVFRNAHIKTFSIRNMIKSYLKTNVLNFEDLDNYNYSNINWMSRTTISIENLDIYGENIDLDSGLLNKDVFKSCVELRVAGGINLIQIDVFKSFKSLRDLDLQSRSLKGMFQRNGIEWIKSINQEVNVEVPIKDETIYDSVFKIHLTPLHSYRNAFISSDESIFPDEDFCLYRNFPFKQLIYILLSNNYLNLDNLQASISTCTHIWLIHFFPMGEIDYLDLIIEDMAHKVEQCNFAKRLDNCNKSTGLANNNNYMTDDTYFVEVKIYIAYFQYILIFISPVVLTIGIITNILIVITVSLNVKTEEMKDRRQYEFMRLYSCSNILACLICLIGMISKCNQYFWCSEFNYSVYVQFYKIIFVELLVTFLRFLTFFTTFGYLLSRISLIGQEHGKFVTKVSKETKMKKLVAIAVLISAILSTVKYFKYTVNRKNDSNDNIEGKIMLLDEYYISAMENTFPVKYFLIPLIFWNSDFEMTKFTLITIFNILSDVVNYVVFFVIILVLEIYTTFLLKKTLNEKMKNISSEEVCKKKEKEKKEANKRMKRMVVFTFLSNLFLRLPMAINSMFEIAITFIYDREPLLFYNINEKVAIKSNFVFFCLGLNGCEMFDDLSNLLYFVSLSLPVIFYNKYDLNFKTCFFRSILRKKEVQNTIQANKNNLEQNSSQVK